MRRRGFTLIELMMAVFLVGVVTVMAMMTFYAVTNGWQASTDYIDKVQRTDFALGQVVSGLRSAYYPHDGQQDYKYGFQLTDNGDGDDPGSSDVIEWSKTGSAIVGNRSAVADTVHRVQVMVLEEGNRDYRDPIEVTGLYARQCPDVALRPTDGDVDYSFGNDEMYQPVLIADGIVGFNCRVLPTADKTENGENDRREFEDEFDASNSLPYKVELTFRIADPEGRSYRSNTAPVMRIVRIPIFEQSQDGATTPGGEEARRGPGAAGRGGSSGTGGSSGGGQGGNAGGGQGASSGPGAPTRERPTSPTGGGIGGGIGGGLGGGM